MVGEQVPDGAGRRGRSRLAALTGVAALLVGVLGVATVLGHRLPLVGIVLDRQPAATGADTEPEPPVPAPLPPGRAVEPPTHNLEHLPDVPRRAVLQGDPATGCAWLEVDGLPQAVRWASGTRVHLPDADPQQLLLVGGDGQLLASAGAPVWFTGATSGAPEELERCHVGGQEVWYVGEVDAIDDVAG